MKRKFSFKCDFLDFHDREEIGWDTPGYPKHSVPLYRCKRCGEIRYSFIFGHTVEPETFVKWERQRRNSINESGSYFGWDIQ